MNGTEREREPSRRGDPDLQTQLESLLHQVWLCEAQWRFEQRLQLASSLVRRDPGRP